MLNADAVAGIGEQLGDRDDLGNAEPRRLETRKIGRLGPRRIARDHVGMTRERAQEWILRHLALGQTMQVGILRRREKGRQLRCAGQQKDTPDQGLTQLGRQPQPLLRLKNRSAAGNRPLDELGPTTR